MLSKKAGLWLGLIIAISLLSLASSCKPSTEEPPDETSKVYKATGKEGTISGVIAYNGAAPEAKKIDTSADSVCASKSPNLATEDWVIKDGKLANTFVYIKDGTLADNTKVSEYSTWSNSPSTATLDQNGCHYKPHLMGVVVNEPISITNSDATTHNVHFPQGLNPDWNQSQASGASPLQHKLTHAETMVAVKCNQHPWMKSYVGVLKHPLFAVSAED